MEKEMDSIKLIDPFFSFAFLKFKLRMEHTHTPNSLTYQHTIMALLTMETRERNIRNAKGRKREGNRLTETGVNILTCIEPPKNAFGSVVIVSIIL